MSVVGLAQVVDSHSRNRITLGARAPIARVQNPCPPRACRHGPHATSRRIGRNAGCRLRRNTCRDLLALHRGDRRGHSSRRPTPSHDGPRAATSPSFIELGDPGQAPVAPAGQAFKRPESRECRLVRSADWRRWHGQLLTGRRLPPDEAHAVEVKETELAPQPQVAVGCLGHRGDAAQRESVTDRPRGVRVLADLERRIRGKNGRGCGTAWRPRPSPGAATRVSCTSFSATNPERRAHPGGTVTASLLYWLRSVDVTRSAQPAIRVCRPSLHSRQPRSTTCMMSGDSAPIRILAVDDHQLVREGIAGFLAVQSDMTLVAQAANGREAIQQFRTHQPRRDADGPADAGVEWPQHAHRHSGGVSRREDHHAHDLRGGRAHPPRRQGGCSGLPAQEHAPYRFAANHPNGPRWQKESVAGGVVPYRPACQR